MATLKELRDEQEAEYKAKHEALCDAAWKEHCKKHLDAYMRAHHPQYF